MASLDRLEQALRGADAAGDVAAAMSIAAEIKRQKAVVPAAPPAPAGPPVATAVGGGKAVDDPIDERTRGILLPIARNEAGEVVFALPGFIKDAIDTVQGILSGAITPDNITGEQTLSLGNLYGGTSVATGTARQIAARAGLGARPRGNAVTQAADRLGVALPRAVASDRPTVRQAGKLVQAVPGGGTPMRRASQNAIDDLGAARTAVQDSAGAGSVTTAADTVTAGIARMTEGPESILARRISEKYQRVEKIVDPAATAPLNEVAKIATTILAERKNAGIPGVSPAVKMVEEAASRPGGLNYAGVSKLRQHVGELLGNKPALTAAGVNEAELKRVYGALTADLKSVVKTAGGDKALRAWEQADRAALKISAIRQKLASVVDTKGGEGAIFSRLEGMAGVSGRADVRGLAKVRAALGKDDWDEVASAMVGRLGEGPDGFSPERFVSGWAKLSDDAKRILFETGKDGVALRRSLDDIAAVSARMKSLREFANPSGTGQTVIGGALGAGGLVGFMFEPTLFLGSVGSILGARVLSNILAKPQGAAPLATLAGAYRLFALKPTAANAGSVRQAAAALAYRVAAEEGLTKADEQALADKFANEPARINALSQAGLRT